MTVRQCTTKSQMCWAVGLWFGLSHPTALTATSPFEHVHGQVDEGMKEWLKQRRAEVPRTKITVDDAKAECTRFFHNISQASIASDVASLPETWQAIVDHHGGFVPDALS
jgi:diadenosine tetraphosphatase ApaH/serine/threonine PP2A family protein phosphatase